MWWRKRAELGASSACLSRELVSFDEKQGTTGQGWGTALKSRAGELSTDYATKMVSLNIHQDKYDGRTWFK